MARAARGVDCRAFGMHTMKRRLSDRILLGMQCANAALLFQ
jgi:hypothetical protein